MNHADQLIYQIKHQIREYKYLFLCNLLFLLFVLRELNSSCGRIIQDNNSNCFPLLTPFTFPDSHINKSWPHSLQTSPSLHYITEGFVFLGKWISRCIFYITSCWMAVCYCIIIIGIKTMLLLQVTLPNTSCNEEKTKWINNWFR